VTDLWAVHTASLQGGIVGMLRSVAEIPDTVMLARDNLEQRTFMCKVQTDSIVWNPRKRPLAFVKLEDLPNPLYNYSTLQNDNRI
jgi:hypothetical protein